MACAAGPSGSGGKPAVIRARRGPREPGERGGGLMTIVMGLDQHRAQITAEWMNTETGEVTRSRISPAHRAGVRQFCERFHGQELEVALEATTGWRFVADEFQRVGASVHLAEPAETAAMRGNKRRAK